MSEAFVPVDPRDVENRAKKRQKIALALLEQCKSEGEITAADLDDIFLRVKKLIVL